MSSYLVASEWEKTALGFQIYHWKLKAESYEALAVVPRGLRVLRTDFGKYIRAPFRLVKQSWTTDLRYPRMFPRSHSLAVMPDSGSIWGSQGKAVEGQISSWPCSFSSSVDLSHMQAWHVSSILKCCRMEWIMSWICSHQPECQQHCKLNPSPVLMLERPSSYSSLFSTIHLSMLLFSYPSIFEYCVSIYCISFFLPSIILHIFLATHPSVHPSAILFIFLIIHLSFYISNMSIHPPTHPSKKFIGLSIHSSNHRSF